MVLFIEGKLPASESAHLDRSPPPSRSRWFRWDWWLVGGSVLAYATVIVYFSNLRSENFFTSAWDLGINQQLLWTGAHGRLLYETPDLAFYNAHSFLQVHSTYVAFLLAPVYGAWPSPLTLFIIQATAFAVSALPFYYLARTTLRRLELALSLTALYLVAFAVLAALMYDFHWESFLPVEYLTFFLLVNARRYRLALVPLAVGTLTLEVFPFLAGGVLLLAIAERSRVVRFHLRALLRDRSTQMLIAIAVLALAGYLMVRLFQYVVIPSTLGVPSVTGGGPSGLGSIFGFAANQVTLPHSMGYWLLLLASLGFLPLLSPRHLILSIPWFYFSVILSPVFSSHFGGPEAFVAFPALAVAAVFGLRECERSDWTDLRLVIAGGVIVVGSLLLMAVSLLPSGSRNLLNYSVGALFWIPAALMVAAAVVMGILLWPSSSSAPARPRIQHGNRRRWMAPAAAVTFVVAILVLDTALSPFNTGNFNATPFPGYEFRFGENPTATQMSWVTSFLPANAQILASDRLFPYVANNPNAWAIPWFVMDSANPVPFFPFSTSNLPTYVLVDSWDFSLVPTFLQSDVFNSSDYGLVAYVYATWFPGTIYLFEHGYRGPTDARDLTSQPSTLVYSTGNLTTGPAGAVVSDPTSTFGRAITSVQESVPNATSVSVWYGPSVTLLPGNYTVTFRLEGSAEGAYGATTPFAFVDGTWEGNLNISSFFRVPINGSQLAPSSWAQIAVPLEVAYPYPSIEFRGFLALEDGRTFGSLTLDSIVVATQPT